MLWSASWDDCWIDWEADLYSFNFLAVDFLADDFFFGDYVAEDFLAGDLFLVADGFFISIFPKLTGVWN